MLNTSTLQRCLSDNLRRVFYCGARAGDAYTLYARDKKAAGDISRQLKSQVKAEPQLSQIRVKTTESIAFSKARCLEAILQQLPHEQILHDPTAIVERLHFLVKISTEAKKIMNGQLRGCYFNSDSRVVYFHLQQAADNNNLTALQQQLDQLLHTHHSMLSQPFAYGIKLAYQQPSGAWLAIDKASVGSVMKKRLGQMFKKLKGPLFLLTTSSLASQAAVAHSTLPAVSGFNGWAGVSGGWAQKFDEFPDQTEDGASGLVEGAIAMPLGHAFGVQAQGYLGSLGTKDIQSVEGYVFWRDPHRALIAPHFQYLSDKDVDQKFYGLHGEVYTRDMTFVVEGGGIDHNRNSNGGYGEALIHWYANPNLRLHVGSIVVKSETAFEVGVEHQAGARVLPNLSVFADAGVGSPDLRYVMVGFRNYFGCPKSLKRRHREDNIAPTLDLLIPAKKVKPTFSS